MGGLGGRVDKPASCGQPILASFVALHQRSFEPHLRRSLAVAHPPVALVGSLDAAPERRSDLRPSRPIRPSVGHSEVSLDAEGGDLAGELFDSAQRRLGRAARGALGRQRWLNLGRGPLGRRLYSAA